MVAAACPRGGMTPQLLKVTYWYLAVMELTGEVERSLGQLTRTLEAHVGPQDLDGHGVADALEVSLGGPLRDDDLVYARKCEGHAIAEAALGEGTHATLAAILDRLEDDVASRDNIQPKAFIRRCTRYGYNIKGGVSMYMRRDAKERCRCGKRATEP